VSRAPRLRSAVRWLARVILGLILLALVLAGLGIGVLETGWAKNQIRALIVRQADQYLTSHLEIGGLGGSFFSGLQLNGIRLSRDGRTLISIDELEVSYGLGELLQHGIVIRRVAIGRLTVAAGREADGRWDLANLVKREARQGGRTGPGRPIEIASIELREASVILSDPVVFGAAHIPTRYESVNGSFSFKYVPVRWTLNMRDVSWRGSAPDLTMNRLSGGIENAPEGIAFHTLTVETPGSLFTLEGRVEKGDRPTTLDLQVRAARFAFQEWGGVITGLRNIAIAARFDTTLRGPLTHLATDLSFLSTGGGIHGALVLDTTVPGWHGAGTVTTDRFDLARWLNNPEKPSDISGRVTFDLAFGFGQHFPLGSYAFDGPHAMFMGYAGDNIHARGKLTDHAALVTLATALAYGADVTTTQGSIGLQAPFPFHFPGTIAGLDLRRLPASIPVPKVESTLAFDYDVTGRFSEPFITGRARFAPSEYLGARIGDGTIGTVDTSVRPVKYGGNGEIDGIDLHRFGSGLDVGWMQDRRYTGTVSGQFHVEGSGTDLASLMIAGGGRLTRADMFGGQVADADVTLGISSGTLTTSFDGRFASIDPAAALDDERFKAQVTGSANLRMTVRDLLLRTPARTDFDIDGTAALDASTVRGVEIDTAHLDAALRNGLATVRHVDAAGPLFDALGAGSISFVGCSAGQSSCASDSDLEYEVKRADLGRLEPFIREHVSGLLATKGRLSGPLDRPRLSGEGTITGLKVPDLEVLTVTAQYDVTIPSPRWEEATVCAEIMAPSAHAFGRTLQQVAGKVALAGRRVSFDVQLAEATGRTGRVAGDALIDVNRHGAALSDLTVTLGQSAWRLATAEPAPAISWSDTGFTLSALQLAGGAAGDQRIGLSGTWGRDGNGRLLVTATHLSLDAIELETPARYGGTLDLEATISGTRQHPIVTGHVSVTEGRVRRFSYQRLAGRVDYDDGDLNVDLRLDQTAGVWLNAAGTVPLGVFNRALPERPIDVAITSSSIDLGLIEGLTDTVRQLSGKVILDVKAIGTSRDVHASGTVGITDAAFLVTSTGSRYKNGRASLALSSDRIDVNSFHVEDGAGRPLDLHGSLGTHELRVGELEIDVNTRNFEVLRNEFGRVNIDAALELRGSLEMPRVQGKLTIDSGSANVDAILERALFQPYSTEPLSLATLDAASALNPWNRLVIDVSLHIPKNLRLVGQDVQITQGTPIGLGDINLRVGGDLYLYRDAGDPVSVTGSLDSISGWYRFQGKRFDIDPGTSSINFRGDLNPELDVNVTRNISGVLTRLSVTGELRSPELRLSSTPPLDASDVLSLILFNTSASDLTAVQQQELAVRAGAIAAGFLATPLISAIQRSLGLDILEVDPTGTTGVGPQVTIGEELAPGLVARFSRQFGQDVFDEAVVEYALSRMLRIRATFSDATSLAIISPFRLVERAGADLIVFFSF
jgi:autotransporter translocation and assembly factor TamB